VNSILEAEFKSLAGIRDALEQLRATGQIGDDTYHKGLVLLASRYARAGDMPTALTLALIPTMDYYRTTQVEQMEADADYLDAAVGLAAAFIDAGMVVEDDAQPTQRPGLA
jgi:hypothetical protein